MARTDETGVITGGLRKWTALTMRTLLFRFIFYLNLAAAYCDEDGVAGAYFCLFFTENPAVIGSVRH